MYYALIGDMVGSKKLAEDERRSAQAALAAALDEVNCRHDAHIAAKFLITLGDECQGLMLPSGDPVCAALTVMHRMRPYPIRFAVGAGDISTPIRHEAAIGADGSAFHNARRVIESMKARHGARLRFALEDNELELRLNTISALCDKLSLQWTDKQELAVYTLLMAKLGGAPMTQAGLAKLLGIGQSTVNEQLKAAGFNEYCAGIMYVKNTLSSYYGGGSNA